MQPLALVNFVTVFRPCSILGSDTTRHACHTIIQVHNNIPEVVYTHSPTGRKNNVLYGV